MAVGVLTGVEPGTKSRASALARFNPVSALLVSCLALAGCTTWAKPGATGAELTRDEVECSYASELAAAGTGSAAGAGPLHSAEGSVDVSCLKARGWTAQRN